MSQEITEGSFAETHRKREFEVAIVPFEVRMRRDLDDQNQVTRRTTKAPRLASISETDF